MNPRSSIFCVALLIAFNCLVTADELPADAWAKLPAHPRLFANQERWAKLRQDVATDPVAKKLYGLIYERAEGVLALPSLELAKMGDHLHGPMRQIQGRISCLSMVYRITDDARFLDRAKVEMTELATTPHWRPGHFLSTSEATLAMAIGLDWLYNDLTDAERDLFANAIIEKGLLQSISEEEKKASWVTSGGNWGPVCLGGMAVGALAVAEREPDLAQRIVNRSIANVSFAAAKYAPVGAHSEGPGYWAYGTNFYVILVEALRNVFGTTCNLEQATGFMKTGDYNIQMTSPTGKMFSYGDSVPEFGFEPAMFWFSRELHGHYLAAATLDRLDEMHDILISDGAMPDASRLQPLALLWWDPTLRASGPDAVPGPLVWWSEGGPQPQAVMRSSWNDPMAAYLGFKAGEAEESHSHMDIGSFLYEVDGIRWAADLGRDFYFGPRRHGMGDDLFRPAQDSKRWAIFTAGPEAHNILRFNGASPWVEGHCEIQPAKSPAAFLVDLTPAYRDQVKTVKRGVSLRPDRSLLVRDEWQTGDHAALVTWQWMTFAKVEIKKTEAILTQDDRTLRLQVLEPTNAHIAVEDLSKAPNAWDSPNPGLSRIVVRVSSPANTEVVLVVVAEPAGQTAGADALRTLPLAQW